MKAAFLTGERELEVRDAELPERAENEALVRVLACGICGSDLHGWHHPHLAVSAGSGPIAGFSGHEIVAEVLDASHRSGPRVVLEPNRMSACGVCPACESGAEWFCRERAPVSAYGFAEQMVVPARSMFAVAESLSDAVATLVEPSACAVHTIRFSHTADDAGRIDGARVAVLGAGVTGLLTVAASRHLGASEVAVTARHGHQAEAARRLGAEIVLDSGRDETESDLRDLRPDLVVEAVGGRATTLTTALRVVAPRGEVAAFGLFDEPQTFDARRAAYKELRLFFPITYGVLGGVHDFEVAIGMLEDAPERFAALVTHEFPLTEIATAFDTAADKRVGSLRVLVVP